MGTVFRARDLTTGGDVAIKVLRQPSVPIAERFAREARVLATIDHPRLPRYVTHGRTTFGEAYLVMEWLDGVDLASRLRLGPLGVAETLALGRAAAEALSIAHAHGIVHRDLKPSNLFLPGGRAEDAKLLDFGIASRLGATDGAGTPAFMAPEQVRGLHDVDARADVFALGAVLYNCLSGQPPFTSGDDVAVLAKVLLEQPTPLRLLDPAIPEGLDELVSEMLDKDPARRPRSTGDVAHLLADLARRPRGTPPPPPAQLARGSAERRVMCLVLCAGELHDPGAVSRDDTIDAPSASPPPRAIRLAVERYGGRLERVPGGIFVASLVAGPHGAPVDVAVRAVRTARALRALDAGARIAVVAGTALATGAAEGAIVDEGIRLLRDTVGDGIRVDDMVGSLLGTAFAIDPATRAIAPLPPQAPPFVGREGELAALAALVDHPGGRAVLVTGVAGIGKSRLAEELERRLADRVTTWLTHADPLRVGSPFGTVAPLVCELCELLPTDDLEQRTRKIRSRVERTVPATDVPRVAEMLGELCGSPFPDDDSLPLAAARRDPQLLHDQLRRAWQDWVAAESAARPLVLVVDDVQWCDAASLRLIEAAFRRAEDRRVLVVGLARPEVEHAFPGLWPGRTDLVLDGEPRTVEVAPELLALLGPASVFGDTFPPATLDEDFDALALDPLLTARPGRQLGFRHPAVRDAAYAQLTPVERVLGHQRAADFHAADPLLRAEHLERSGAMARAIEPLTEAAERASIGGDPEGALRLAERALLAGPPQIAELEVIAAEALAALARPAEAVARAGTALRLATPASPLWFRAVRGRAAALLELGRHEGLEELAGLLWSQPDGAARDREHALAIAEVARQLFLAGRAPRARALLRRLDPDELADDDPAVAATIYRAQGVRSVAAGDYAAALDDIAAAIVCYDRAGHLGHGYQQRAQLGHVYNALGVFAQAAVLLEEVVGGAARAGFEAVGALAEQHLGFALAGLGRHDDARRATAHALSVLEDPRRLAVAYATHAHVLRLGKALPEAEAAARRAIEVSVGSPSAVAMAYARLAEVLLARGQKNAALAAAEKANAVLDDLGGTDEGEIVIRLAWAESFFATGLESRARDALRVCRQRLLALAERISNEKWRKSFLTAVPENARIMALAHKILS
jgi:eukaryotic-like serine/threonine-protein kinase